MTPTLPNADEAERALLASLLIWPREAMDSALELRPEDFFREQHQVLFRAILQLSSEGRPIDLVTVTEQLKRSGDLEVAGGVAAVSGIDAHLPERLSHEAYASDVLSASLRRSLISGLSECVQAANNGIPLDDLVERVERVSHAAGARRYGDEGVPASGPIGEILGYVDQGREIRGLPTGFPSLDALTTGLPRQTLTYLAGRPGMGKTSLALNIAANVALRRGIPVRVFSLEMSAQELALRLIASESWVPMKSIKKAHLSTAMKERIHAAAERIVAAPLVIDDSATISLAALRSRVRRHKPSLVVLDYIQLMHDPTSKGDGRQIELEQISGRMKAIAREANVPMLVLSQLSRKPAERREQRPQLSDLRGSGALEQDADLVGFIYRPDEVFPEKLELKGRAELIIAKQRQGETGTIPLRFAAPLTTFYEEAA